MNLPQRAPLRAFTEPRQIAAVKLVYVNGSEAWYGLTVLRRAPKRANKGQQEAEAHQHWRHAAQRLDAIFQQVARTERQQRESLER